MGDYGLKQEDGKAILAGIQSADCLNDIAGSISRLLCHFGFLYYKLFLSRLIEAGTLRQQLLLYSVPEAFLDGFDAIGGLPPAPIVIMAASERQAYQWGVADLEQKAQSFPQVRRLMDLLSHHDMSRGAYFSLPTLDGRKHILGVYGTREPLPQAEMEELNFLAIHLLDRMEVLEKRRGWQRTGISTLEMTCLEMAASGHDSAAIARRLSLSVRTINYLIGSLCRKLGTDRLEHAVIEAVRMGYIG